MAEIERLSIALPEPMAAAVRHAVEVGEYASTSEVIRDALRLWEMRRQLRERDLEVLRQRWDEGKASGRAGPLDVPRLIASERAQLVTPRRTWLSCSSRGAPRPSCAGSGVTSPPKTLPRRTALLKIDDRLQILRDFPNMGALRADIRPGFRMLVEGNYLLLYEYDEANDAVELMSVIDARQDLTELF